MMRRKKKWTPCKPQDDEKQREAMAALDKLGKEAAREILAFEHLRLKNKEAKPT
jgi:hypothetical protein